MSKKTRCDELVSNDNLAKKNWSMARKRLVFLLQNFLVANRHPRCLAARPRQCPQTPWCQLQQTHARLVSFSIILVLFLGSDSVSSAFSRVFYPQTNAVGLNFDWSRTVQFESSSTPQGTTSFYAACDSLYIIINNENHPHGTIWQV